jgi:hypothetical protein
MTKRSRLVRKKPGPGFKWHLNPGHKKCPMTVRLSDGNCTNLRASKAPKSGKHGAKTSKLDKHGAEKVKELASQFCFCNLKNDIQ